MKFKVREKEFRTMHYYESVEECDKTIKRVNTNPRYKNFTQTDYTVGDTEQFNFVYNLDKGKERHINIDTNIFNDHVYDHGFFDKYRQLSGICTKNTFEYMFFKFKKGVYIKIKNNKLELFQPFSNANFSNEWSSNIRFTYDVFKQISTLDGREFRKHRINKFVKNWFANNHLVRYEFPVNETDTNLDVLKDMFIELCKLRRVPDMEFFLNKRDYPILTKDETEPYESIWNGTQTKLVSHLRDKYVPILSMCISSRFADVLIPTYEDWSRVERKNGKFFISTCKRSYKDISHLSWEKKKNIAVFRGSNTGPGVTIDTNTRLKLCAMSSELEKQGIEILDAGITVWNTRPRKEKGDSELKVINFDDLPFELKEPLTPTQQSEYKYIVNVDGHVAAYRLSLELGMNCVILKVDSEWKIWYSHLLKPYVHYIPIKNDLSDLVEKIHWCQQNDKKCKNIAKNAFDFYQKYLCKDSILDYLQKTLCDLKLVTGHYKSDMKSDRLFRKQIGCLNKSLCYPGVNTPLDTNQTIKYNESYECFKTLEYVINYLIINNTEELVTGEIIFSNSKSTILKTKILGVDVVIKINEKNKSSEVINSTYIGKYVINDFIRKNLSNFAYTYNTFTYSNKLYSISQYVDGILLPKLIQSTEFTIDSYLDISLQICLCLQSTQDICKYIHNDLTPWNIVIKRFDKPKAIEYRIGDRVYTVYSNVVPVILDYEKSEAVHNNTFYGTPRTETVLLQDFITYFVTSLNMLTKKETFSEGILLKLSNCLHFLGVSTYFNTMSKVKFFLYYNRKFDYLTRLYEKVDTTKTPLDIFKYILNTNKRTTFRHSIHQTTRKIPCAYRPASRFRELFGNQVIVNDDIVIHKKDITNVVTKYYVLYLLETYCPKHRYIKELYKRKFDYRKFKYKFYRNDAQSFELNDILSIILTFPYRLDINPDEKQFLKKLKEKINKSVKNNALNSFL